MKEFDTSIKTLSKRQLKRLAKIYKISHEADAGTQSLCNALTNGLNANQKLEALKDSVLAGRGSVAMRQFTNDSLFVEPQASDTKITREPTIISVGEFGQIWPGQQHILWAALTSKNTYLDKNLKIRSDDEADIFHSFYEPETGILHIRANATIARRIERSWAEHCDIDLDEGLKPIGFDAPDRVHRFATQIEAVVKKCKGDLHESRGFLNISGTKHPDTEDLIDSDDYKDFLDRADATDLDLECYIGDELVSFGLGLKSKSVAFRTYASESTVNYICSEIKQFFGVAAS
ncbi:MAG: hypothetical protein ACSHX5_00185 [Phycisphaerales bacterium]